MHKVVYNGGYGGFRISDEAVHWLIENGSEETKEFLKQRSAVCKGYSTPGSVLSSTPFGQAGWQWTESIPRHHKDLVAVVEALGELASGKFSNLRVHELSGNQYWIEEYDGSETVHEPSTEEWITIED